MDAVVDLFRALADPTRLRIVALLGEMELSVGELAQLLDQSQPRVSRHVRILCDAGLAKRRREGSWIFLAPGDPRMTAPIAALLDLDGTWRAADRERLTDIRQERAAAAQRYFAAHAGDWDRIRALHVDDGQVEYALSAMLGDKLGRLADLGTGTGRMLELFGPRAEASLGVDRSPEMLRLARVKLDGQGRYDLRQGDVTALPLGDASADTVILHQVLHYLGQPEAALAEAARILAPDGQLAIVDFAAHEYEELRQSAAHARLGFSDAQMCDWLAAAGLTLTASETLAGELTVRLWRAVKPSLKQRLAA